MASTLLWLLASFLALNLIPSAIGERNFRISLDNITARHWIPELVDSLNFHVEQLRNRSYLSGHLLLRQSITELYVHTFTDFSKPSGQLFRMYDVRLDGCLFLNTMRSNRLFSVLLKAYRKTANQPLKCPIKPNFNYTVTNWHLDENDFPSYVPQGSFKSIIEIKRQEKPAVRLDIRGRVIYL